MKYLPKILITGCNGFIFSNFLRYAFEHKLPYQFIGVDICDEDINIQNIFHHKNFTFYMNDICDQKAIENIFKIEKPDIVIHSAAHSFVCSSIENPEPFFRVNVLGTQVLASAAVKYGVKNFFYINTDEIFGSLGENEEGWKEDALTNPSSPYSASKMGGELVVRSFHKTFGLPYTITRCCNIYGPRQNKRNLISKSILSIANDITIPLHNNGTPIREWMFVEDKITAILTILEKSPMNETYNIGSDFECSNNEAIKRIAETMDKAPRLSYATNRPGQDWRYRINSSKLRALGWKPQFSFDQGIKNTIEWCLSNPNFYL